MTADPEARAPEATTSPVLAEGDRHQAARTASGEIGFTEAPENLLITVPEAACLLRVSVRSVWRQLAEPTSRFPKPRRIRGRTLLVRDELLAFLKVGSLR